MDHSQHEQYRDESAWEVRQLRLELEAVRKGEEYIRPARYTVTQKGKEGGSAIPKDKLIADLLSSLNNLLTPTMEFKKKEWVGLTDEEKHEIRYSHMTSAEFIEFIEAKLKQKNNVTWVGLTDEEKHEIRYSHMTSADFIEFIEAKLKQKNNG